MTENISTSKMYPPMEIPNIHSTGTVQLRCELVSYPAHYCLAARCWRMSLISRRASSNSSSSSWFIIRLVDNPFIEKTLYAEK